MTSFNFISLLQLATISLFASAMLLTLRFRRMVNRTERLAANDSRKPRSKYQLLLLFFSASLLMLDQLLRSNSATGAALPTFLAVFGSSTYLEIVHFRRMASEGRFSRDACNQWIIPGYLTVGGCLIAGIALYFTHHPPA
jgi:hypothetical protein